MSGERESLEEIKEGDKKNAGQAAKRRSYGHSSKTDDRGFVGKENGTVAARLKMEWKKDWKKTISKKDQNGLQNGFGPNRFWSFLK